MNDQPADMTPETELPVADGPVADGPDVGKADAAVHGDGAQKPAPSLRRRIFSSGVYAVIIVAAAAFGAWLFNSDSINVSETLADTGGEAAPVFRGEQVVLPEIDPAALKPLTEEEAFLENAELPFDTSPLERAAPLVLSAQAGTLAALGNAQSCLTAAVYYEAGFEPEQGKRGVAQVILNRVRHRAFPNSVCGVVYQGSERRTGCQFTFTCDGSLSRKPAAGAWQRAQSVAAAALAGAVEPAVGMATHYHADYVVPYWASSLAKVAKSGSHIFYRWKGSPGKRAAFTQNVTFAADDSGQIPQFDENGVRVLDGFDVVPSDEAFVPRSNIYADQTSGEVPEAGQLNRGLGNAPLTPNGQGAAETAGDAAPSVPAVRADEGVGDLVADERAGELVGP
jgi:hypothetical protein